MATKLNEDHLLILDLRAHVDEGVDDALVLDTASTMDEAVEAAKAQGGGIIWDCNENERAGIVSRCRGGWEVITYGDLFGRKGKA